MQVKIITGLLNNKKDAGLQRYSLKALIKYKNVFVMTWRIYYSETKL